MGNYEDKNIQIFLNCFLSRRFFICVSIVIFGIDIFIFTFLLSIAIIAKIAIGSSIHLYKERL